MYAHTGQRASGGGVHRPAHHVVRGWIVVAVQRRGDGGELAAALLREGAQAGDHVHDVAQGDRDGQRAHMPNDALGGHGQPRELVQLRGEQALHDGHGGAALHHVPVVDAGAVRQEL